MYENCMLPRLLYFNVPGISSIFLLLCSSSFLWMDSSQGQEMARRRTSNVCRDHLDCPKNAFCEKSAGLSNGQCVCHQGFILIGEKGKRECYRSASTIGDGCIYDEQCMITLSTESECKYGRCECRTGTHYVEKKNTCYKSVRIGEFCTFTNNCLGEGAVCRSGVCHCPYGKHPRFDAMDCIPDVHLGEKCSYDEECVSENTRCSDICRCKVSHVISKSGDSCLRVSKNLHDACDEDHQCSEIIPNSRCDPNNSTCICKEGYHEINYVSITLEDLTFMQQMKLTVSLPLQKCWVSVPLGGICEVDENCSSVENTICFEGRCICHDGLKAIGGICSAGSYLKFSQRNLALILLIYYLFIA